MKHIDLELSVQSCNRAVKEIEKYEKDIKPKLDEVCKRLAEIGAQEATAIVSQVRLAEGNAVERIGVEQINNGWKIVMEGEDVYFIEFGTGDGVSPHFDSSVPVAWGTWSAEHKQMLWNYGFWYYNKVRFTGTQAYMPMYYAERKMREEMPRIVREVFGR